MNTHHPFVNIFQLFPYHNHYSMEAENEIKKYRRLFSSNTVGIRYLEHGVMVHSD